MIKKLLILSLLGIMAVPGITSAACDPTADPASCAAPDVNFINSITKILNLIFWGVLVVAVVFFMIAGFKIITAGGDPKAMGDAMAALRNGIIGIIIAAAAIGLSKFASGLLG